MADDLSRFLSSGKPHTALSPERLEIMGKEAATLFVEKGVPLNESIAKLAAPHDVNQEQVKRIVEFANQATYLALHDKNKTAGADSSYPQFELADAGRILGDLASGSRPTRITQVDLDYSRLPSKPKIASARLEAELEELFLGTKEKRANVLDFSTDTVVDHIVTTKQNLVALKESLESSAEQLDSMLKGASAEYYDGVKQHLLEGGSFVDVLRGAQETGLTTTKIAAMLQPMVVRLIKEKVAKPDALRSQTQELDKVAHRMVDTDHPFVATFGAIASLSEEIDKVAIALEEVDVSLARVNSAIREEFFAP